MEDEEKIRKIHEELLETYGEPPKPDNKSGVDYLIETILSQNTNDENRDKAFENLKDEYGEDYSRIEEADTEEIIDQIRIAGLGPTKAGRIQEALTRVRERNGDSYSMNFLSEMSTEEAMEWLQSIKGIGPKSAAVILCFGFGMDVFPVDTHVHRLSGRLGLVPENTTREKTFSVMDQKVPDEIKYSLHRLLIRHGREECTAREDDCWLCRKYG